MKFRLNKQVEKDLRNIKDKNVLLRFQGFLEEIKTASSLMDLSNIKKMKGEENFYRHRFGDYRVGFKVEDDCVLILKVAHRREIYRNFP